MKVNYKMSHPFSEQHDINNMISFDFRFVFVLFCFVLFLFWVFFLNNIKLHTH